MPQVDKNVEREILNHRTLLNANVVSFKEVCVCVWQPLHGTGPILQVYVGQQQCTQLVLVEYSKAARVPWPHMWMGPLPMCAAVSVAACCVVCLPACSCT